MQNSEYLGRWSPGDLGVQGPKVAVREEYVVLSEIRTTSGWSNH